MKETTKNKLMTSWRIIVAIGMLSVTFIALLVGYIYYKEEIRDQHRTWSVESDYSDLYKYEYDNKHNYIRLKELKTGKYLTPRLTDIHTRNLNDSITVFFQAGKRGFLNIYTGRIVVEAQFERAWVFSEGLGAVVMENKVGFVDKTGEFVIPCRYKYMPDKKNKVDFLFKGGFCSVIGSNGKHGLIDKTGKWVVQPQYDYINKPINGLRVVKSNDRFGVIDSTLTQLLPFEYQWISLMKDGMLLTKDDLQLLVAYDGKTILKPFVFNSSESLWYETDILNDEGEYVSKLSAFRKFYIPCGYGLFDATNNKVITRGIYREITAINNNLFECQLKWPNEGSVFINSKGEVVK